MHITLEYNPFTNSRRVYVTAPLDTNTNTMRAMARKYMNARPCPDYVEFNGTKRPGQWAQHLGTAEEFKAMWGKPAKRRFWELVVIPKWSK